MDTDEFVSRAESIGSTYYGENRKNVLFNRKRQKDEVAALVTKELSVERCIQEAVYHERDSDEGRIAINFPNLKRIAHPDIYVDICKHGISLVDRCIEKHGTYSVSVNLAGLTVSGMDRFRVLIEMFFSLVPAEDVSFAQCIRSVVVYNAPSFFDSVHQIVRRFISSDSSHLELTRLPKSDENNERFARL